MGNDGRAVSSRDLLPHPVDMSVCSNLAVSMEGGTYSSPSLAALVDILIHWFFQLRLVEDALVHEITACFGLLSRRLKSGVLVDMWNVLKRRLSAYFFDI